jgi:hypothetical protein
MNQITKIMKKSKLLLAGAVFGLALATAGTISFAQAQPVIAASCDTVNIIHCGLDGSTVSGYITSMQTFYNNGTDNGNNDLKAVYQWAGATDSDISGMNATNTKLGTLYKNGDIQVNGVVVAKDASVTARFNGGAGFEHVEGNVYARKTTVSFANASVQALVHYDANGQVDFAVMVDCGNSVKVTPVPPVTPPAPKPVLACTLLTFSEDVKNPLQYSFVATATATNTTIKSYTYNFGDGTTVTIPAATTTHTFAANDKAYVVTVAVNGADQTGVTSATCKVTFTTPKVQECKPGIPVNDARCTECKPGIPANDSRCTECKPGIPANDIRCTPATPVAAVTPTPPTELPATGPGEIVGLFAGTSALGAVGHQLFRRRANRA